MLYNHTSSFLIKRWPLKFGAHNFLLVLTQLLTSYYMSPLLSSFFFFFKLTSNQFLNQ